MESNEYEKRLAELEERVLQLEREVLRKRASFSYLSHKKPERELEREILEGEETEQNPPFWQQSDFWLNKVGVSLLIVSMAYFFVYSVEQGWLGILTRLLIGIITGISLIGLSYLVRDDRIRMPDLLKGAGFGVLYLTTYAADQWFLLLPDWLASAAMISITIFAFGLTWLHKREYIGLFAALGGYVSPFLLSSENPNVLGLLALLVMISVTASLLSLLYQWRILGVFSMILGWITTLIGYINLYTYAEFSISEQMLIAVFFALMVFSTGPARLLRWKATENWLEWDYAFLLTPCIYLFLLKDIFAFQDTTTGIAGFILALLLIAGVYSVPKNRNANAVFMSSMLFVGSVAFYFLVESNLFTVFPVLLASFSALVIRDKKDSYHFLDWLYLLLGLAVSIWIFQERYTPIRPFLHWEALLVLSMFTATGFALRIMPFDLLNRTVGLVAHSAVMTWIWAEFHVVTLALLFTTSLWVLYSVGMLIWGVRQKSLFMKRLGFGTLGFIILKLLIVDLENLDVFWRFVLLAGVGAFLMGVSYVYKKLTQTE